MKPKATLRKLLSYLSAPLNTMRYVGAADETALLGLIQQRQRASADDQSATGEGLSEHGLSGICFQSSLVRVLTLRFPDVQGVLSLGLICAGLVLSA